jgi:hypothetical protein
MLVSMTDDTDDLASRPTTLTARFSMSGWDPAPLVGLDGDGDWVGAIVMRKTYTAGILGESVAEFLSSGGEETGRGYLAAERITGRLEDGRSGAFTVHHGGLQHPGGGSSFGYLVPGSGTGDFAEWAGTARIDHDDEGAFFTFVLE